MAAVIRAPDERVLVSLRPAQADQGGLWEFPGGKLLPAESRYAALCRELREELGIAVRRAAPLIEVRHAYPDKTILLDVWEVYAWDGEPVGLEGQDIRWVPCGELDALSFPAANWPVIRAAALPRLCLVTPEPAPSQEAFLLRLESLLSRGIGLVQLRAKSYSAEAYRRLALRALERCRAHGTKLLLNASPALVQEIAADGVHLTSSRLRASISRPLPGDYLVSAACHDATELAKASALGVDFALVSPVLSTPSHPQATPLGWERLRELVAVADLPAFGLGGLTPVDLVAAVSRGCQGIAAIRGLWDCERPLDTPAVRTRLAAAFLEP